jgi:four helix bundle protein
MDKHELKVRTKNFAHKCVKVAISFPKDKLGSHIQGQLIRCSTSVAANYRAAIVAQSTASFVAKLSIVIEEVDESNFWLGFALDEKIISGDIVSPLIKESKELTSIFISSRKTLQSRNNKIIR